MKNRNDIIKEKVLEILSEVKDPEIPVISIADLGILRDVIPGETISIIITPTYSGCPAIDAVSMNIRFALFEAGIRNFEIVQQLSPAWTTDWITAEGREQLQAYGIAPPVRDGLPVQDLKELSIECPLCRSSNTALISEFGSTACKALFQCRDCLEPFDYFKCH